MLYLKKKFFSTKQTARNDSRMLQSGEVKVEVEINDDDRPENERNIPILENNNDEDENNKGEDVPKQEVALREAENDYVEDVLQDCEREENDGLNLEVRRSARERKPKKCTCCQVQGQVYEELQTVEEAINRKDRDKWKQAMDKETKSIRENQTWTLVKRPRNANIIGCKWVFKKK